MLLNRDRTKIIYYLPTSQQQTIIIPYSVKTIADYAFHSCHYIEEVFIPEGYLESIGFESFKNCTRLSRVILPTSLEYIYNNAFESCKRLQCGCFTVPDVVIDKIEWNKTGVPSSIYGDYCLSQKCYINHIRITCEYKSTNSIHVSLFYIFLTSH